MFRRNVFLVLLSLRACAAFRVHNDLANMVANKPPWFSSGNEDPEEVTPTPSFDDLARVRSPELIRNHIHKNVVPWIIQTAMSEKCMFKTLDETLVDQCKPSGLNKVDWEKFAEQAKAFDNGCKAQDSVCKGKLSYKGFLALPEAESWAKSNPTFIPSADLELTDKSKVKKYLKSKGYWTRRPWDKATPLAESFLKEQRADMLGKLQIFVFLDKNHDGVLKFAEVLDYLPAGQIPQGLSFDELARVRVEDFEVLGFPKHMIKGIMSSWLHSDSHDPMETTIREAMYKKKHIQELTTEFRRMDEEPPQSSHESLKKEERNADKFEGRLKFYQFARALPKVVEGEEVADGTQITVADLAKHFGEDDPKTWDWVAQAPITVPTMADVTGEKGRVELSAKELEKWLDDSMGMGNSNRFVGAFTGNKFKHAKKLAANVMAWADGKTSYQNGRIDAKEWSNVAGRLALFLKLDEDKDGKVSFPEAAPYLKKWIENGKPANGV